MTAARVRAVVFDLDGTLVDSREAVIEAVARGVRDVARRHGHGEVEIDESVLIGALGKPSREYFRAILPGRLVDLADEVKAVATRHEVEALRSGHGRLFEGVLPTLESLRASGIRLACVSNAQQPYFRAALECLGLDFEYSECQEELPEDAAPPYKIAMLRRALSALGIDPRDAVMVGDREEDIASGVTVGCRTVGVTFGFGDADELARADARIDRFTELAEVVGRW